MEENWSDGIGGAFGHVDKKFALHELDIVAARDVLIKALKAGSSYADYISEFQRYLKNLDLTDEHIDQQIKRVETLESYFGS